MPRYKGSKPPATTRGKARKFAERLLADKIRRTWQRQLTGMLSFLERMEQARMPEADEWYLGQAEHFRKRILLLLEVTPKDCRALAEDFRKRLEKLRIFH